MQPVHDMKRQMIRELIAASQSGNTQYLHAWGISAHAATALSGLAAHEIEQMIVNASDRIRLNLDAVISYARGTRRENLAREMMQAGCCNRILSRQLGLGRKDLTALRRDLGISNPGRPRHLNKSEKECLHDWLDRHPCSPHEHERAIWCLRAWRKHRFPYMSIHQFLTHDIFDN